jgi:CSLREA domain-containing protein
MSTPFTRGLRRFLIGFRVHILVAASVLSLAPPAPSGNLLYVVDSLADDGSGGCTLREAINAANGGGSDCGPAGSGSHDEIQFAVSGTVSLGSPLPTVSDDLTISAGSAITIDGVHSFNILTVNGGTSLTLNDIALVSAYASTEGGAIRSLGTLSVNDSTFIGNRANPGGGAIYSIGSAVIHDSTFEANISDSTKKGGAIWSSGPLTVQGGQFLDNEAGAGGAIYVRHLIAGPTVNITGATFTHNLGRNSYPNGNGAALLIDNVPTTIQASTFTQNNAQSGGAIYVEASGVMTLTASTLHDNVATNGGGLYNKGAAKLAGVTLSANGTGSGHGGGIDNFGLLNLANVTLSGNSATYGSGLKSEAGTAMLLNVTLSGNLENNINGGAIFNTGASTHLELRNVIVANTLGGPNCKFGTVPYLSVFNLSSDNSCNFGPGRDNLDLRLGPLANNGGPTQTHLPGCYSPAIDNGTDDDVPGVDQRGITRPFGTFFDVGSVEVGPGEPKECLYLPLVRR